MLSISGWLNGTAALGYVLFGIIFGAIIFYKGIKLKAKLLYILGLSIIFAGFIILGPASDFLVIIFTGKNIDNRHGLVGILSFFGVVPATILAMYIGSELLIPKYKNYIISIFSALGIVYLIFLFLDPLGSFSFSEPEIPGEEIIDTTLIRGSPIFILAIIFQLSVLIFNGFGFLIKRFQSSGILKKKFSYLSFGYFLFVILTFLEGYISLGIFLVFIRIGLICSFMLWYYGVREETIKIKEISYKTKIEKNHLELIERLYKSRPEKISDEEISFYKEQEICIICKNKIAGLTFICPNCKALYCVNCYEAIKNTENSCWVCNDPIDQSKPSKPFKKDEDIIEIKDFKDPKIPKEEKVIK